MIEPQATSPLDPVAMSPDEVLIGEIPPAMRRRLRTIGQFGGLILGLMVFVGVVACEPLFQQFLGSQLGLDMPALRLASDCLHLLGLAALFVLPLVFARVSLLLELGYRRKHGKWRWEW